MHQARWGGWCPFLVDLAYRGSQAPGVALHRSASGLGGHEVEGQLGKPPAVAAANDHRLGGLKPTLTPRSGQASGAGTAELPEALGRRCRLLRLPVGGGHVPQPRLRVPLVSPRVFLWRYFWSGLHGPTFLQGQRAGFGPTFSSMTSS